MRNRTTILIILLTTLGLNIIAQSPIHDGIALEISKVNRNSFVYGEPISIIFNITNKKNTPNEYYYPTRGVNYTVSLLDLRNGSFIPEKQAEKYNTVYGHLKEQWMKEKPSNEQSYKPNEETYIGFDLNKFFAYEKMVDEPIRYEARLGSRLYALPVGEYEMQFEYSLFPSSVVLSSVFRFVIVDTPVDERDAFEQYIRTTYYPIKNDFWVSHDYMPSHPDSYENFIKKYPNSRYAQAAMIDGTYWIYGTRLVEGVDRTEKFNTYLKFYTSIAEPDVRARYFSYLPAIQKQLFQQNVPSKEIDKVLKNLEYELPDYSRIYKRLAEANNPSLKLKNYAKERSEQKPKN